MEFSTVLTKGQQAKVQLVLNFYSETKDKIKTNAKITLRTP
jgi:hypothetical protein